MTDKENPYPFQQWLALQKVSSNLDTQQAYMEYLKNWYIGHNKNFLKTKEQTKQEYLQLIKDLSYLFNQEEKDRFLNNIDYDNPEELIYAIPYFAKKLKEIAKVLNAKRNSVKNSKLKYNLVGSNDGLESLLYEYLLRAFTKTDNFITQVPSSSLQNLFPDLSSVKDNFFIEIEELYDTNNYLDSDPTVDIKEYVNVEDLLGEFPYEDLTEDEIIGLLNTRFLPRVARNPLSKAYQAYLTSLQSATATNLDISLETNLINYQIAATEKYLGDSLYGLTAIRLKDLNLPDQTLNLNFTEGNNWFIWPSGSKSVEKEISDNILAPIEINNSNLVNSGATGGSSLLDSDLIFTDKNGIVEGAWLRGVRTITGSNTARLKINPLEVKEFIYPYVGFNLTAKGANWGGHSLNDDSFGTYSLLNDEKKKEVLDLYYTETLPNSSLVPIYLNQTSLINNGAKAGEFTFDSDVFIKRNNNENSIAAVYNDTDENATEASFLYKFQKTNIAITLGLNQIYWPIKEFDSDSNIPLTVKNNHSIPVSLANLDVPETMPGAVAGLDFNSGDVIYKLNSRTGEPLEAAWLGSNTIQNLDAVSKSIKIYDENAIKCAKYIDGPIQPALALRVNSSEKVSFVWNDTDTPADEVFKFYEHAPNCPYGKESFNYYEDQDYQNPSPLKNLNHWEKCNCKSVYYSPIGHEGDIATDYNTMGDLLFEDPDGLGTNFNFDNWTDTRGYDYKNSPQFAFYKLESGDTGVGWGKGFWKNGVNKKFILKTGRRYTYVRSSLRKDSSSDGGVVPYYIVNYSYKELRGICTADPTSVEGCYDLIIALDISNSQKLSLDKTKQLVTEVSKTILSKSTAIQIGLIVFNKDVTLLSYLTKEAAGIEFNLYAYNPPDTNPEYKTDLSNALNFSEFLLKNKIPPDVESNTEFSDICDNLNVLIADESVKVKTFNAPQNCAKKILIISDGESNINADLVTTKANEVKSSGVEIYAVDIGLLSYDNTVMENIVSKSGYYFNLQKYINEGNGDVFSLSQRVAAVLNTCTSVVPSWNKAIRNSDGSWIGLYEPTDMVLDPGDYIIYVHRESVNYVGEETESGFSTPTISFALNIKLNGWDYTNNTFSLNNIGESYGGRPYWAVSDTVPTNTFNKETNHFGGNVKFAYEYVPVRQPEISNIVINNGDFIQYFRRSNVSLIWNQPITLSTTLSDFRWNKILFEKEFYNLDDILRNNQFNYYGFSSEEPSDLLLESYSEFKLSRFNYFARNEFTYNQDLFFLNRCENTFVVFTSGEVLSPIAPYANLLNVHYPTVGVLNIPKNLVSKKQYGGYLNPINLGVSYYRGKGYTIEIDKNQISLFDNLSAEKIFFDINKYGSRNRGLTKKDQYSPVTIKTIDNRWMVETFNSGEKRGMIINTRENQKFTPYQTTYEILNKNTSGLSRQNDKIEFWTETSPSLWNDEKNYPLTYRKELMASTYELRKKGLLADIGEMVQWRTDLIGNEYGLFKGEPTPFIVPQEPIIGQNSTYFGFGAATGALTNQHWIHYARWSSEFNIVETGDLISNGNLLGDAEIVNGSIKLTRALEGKSGHIYYKNPVFVKNNLGRFIDWSVYFIFSMGGGSRADGLGLILQSNSLDTGGGGGGMGYEGIANSVGVFFDSYQNVYDPNNNHIEIDANGNVDSSLAVQSDVDFDMCGTTGLSKYVYAWVDYSATTETMRVYISENQIKPSSPALSTSINLDDYLLYS